MPRANPADAFVWRSSIGPRRIRLAGALAIALSCGGLGVLAGRWSLQVGTAEPGTRTAALIAAVSEETRAKPTSASNAGDGGAAAAPASLTEPAAQPTREAGPTLLARPQREPPHLAPPQPEHAQAADKPDAATAASPTPVGGAAAAASAAAMGGWRPGAPPSRATPTAPNYQALRDYALSR
jgi:hypothetical protein